MGAGGSVLSEEIMASNKPTQKLFKKAYYFNWDDGVSGLQKIIEDRHCELATATMIYWHGRPEGPHGPEMSAFLDGLKAKILGSNYPIIISYAIEPEFLPTTTDSVPPRLLEPIVGEIEFKDVLWPNHNPFQDEVLALCQHCDDAHKVKELESKGADFSKKILNGYALPIIVAINHGQLKVVKYLVSKGLDLNKKVDRAPLLAYAVGARSPEMIAWMIAHGANVNAKGQFGRTALHGMAGDLDPGFDDMLRTIADHLVAAGADFKALDSDKKTPRDLAEMWSNTKYSEYLDDLLALG